MTFLMVALTSCIWTESFKQTAVQTAPKVANKCYEEATYTYRPNEFPKLHRIVDNNTRQSILAAQVYKVPEAAESPVWPSGEFGLKLAWTDIVDRQLAWLDGLDNLRILDVSFNLRLTDQSLEFISKVRTIDSLDVSNTAIKGPGVIHLSRLPKLRHLDLSYTECKDAHLDGLLSSCRLEYLGLYHTHATSATMKTLQGIHTLRGLSIGGPWIDEDAILEVAKNDKIRSLTIARATLTDRALVAISGMKRLERLVLAQIDVSDKGLSCVGKMDWLKSLSISSLKSKIEVRIPIGDFSELVDLSVLNCTIEQSVIIELRKCHCLRSLELEYVELGKPELAAISSIRSLRSLCLLNSKLTSSVDPLFDLSDLRELDLSYSSIRDRDMSGIGRLSHLIKLGLGSTLVGDEDLPFLPALKALRELQLYATATSDQGVRNIAKLASLQELDCRGCKKLLGRTVSELRKCQSLHQLTLSQNRLHPNIMEDLATITKLMVLDISETSVPIGSFQNLQGMKNLRRLDLFGADLDAESKTEIEQKLPGVLIRW